MITGKWTRLLVVGIAVAALLGCPAKRERGGGGGSIGGDDATGGPLAEDRVPHGWPTF